MNYKVKSLLFFIAFVLSTVIYYAVDQIALEEINTPNTEIADMESEEDIPTREDETVSFVE